MTDTMKLNRRAVMSIGLGAATMAVTGGTALGAEQSEPDMQKNKDETGEYKLFKEMLKSSDVVKLKTEDGRNGDSVSVASDTPGQRRVKEKFVPYVVPEGYIKKNANFEKSHHSGDSAECRWENDDPHDGTVYLRAQCSGLHGSARAAVSDAYAIKEKASKKLYEMAKEFKSKEIVQ
jgi:hypothetical protein